LRRLAAASLVLPLTAALFLLLSAGCGGNSASTAADPYISQAADGEEREGLTQARDDIDAEMRAVAAQKDAEIARLEKENAALKARLAARARK
jgi:hypothetical protein